MWTGVLQHWRRLQTGDEVSCEQSPVTAVTRSLQIWVITARCRPGCCSHQITLQHSFCSTHTKYKLSHPHKCIKRNLMCKLMLIICFAILGAVVFFELSITQNLCVRARSQNIIWYLVPLHTAGLHTLHSPRRVFPSCCSCCMLHIPRSLP